MQLTGLNRMSQLCYFQPIVTAIFLLTLSSCQLPKPSNRKVIVIHARGIAYPDLRQYLDIPSSLGFFHQQEQEGRLHQLTPITNAVTTSNLASFATGLPPAQHGIIGHNFGIWEDTTIRITSGFSHRYEAETFWEKADRQGKKVLHLGALVLHGKYDEPEAIDCLAQGSQRTTPKLLRLVPQPFQSRDSVIGYQDLSGDKSSFFHEGKTDSLIVYRRSKSPAPEALVIDRDYDYENGYLGSLSVEEWLEIEDDTLGSLKTSFRIKYLALKEDTIDLYVRASFANRGYPQDFLQDIDSQLGPARGWPNIPWYAREIIDFPTLMEEITAETNYLMDAFSHTTQKTDYDLIVFDYPLMDRMGHAFLRDRPTSKEIRGAYQKAFQKMEEDFSKIGAYANQHDFELIITSGHGFSSIHTSIDIKTLLHNQGMATPSTNNQWEMLGVAGKVSAHIYLNPNLDENQRTPLLQKVEAAFAQLTFPETGEKVVDTIYQRANLSSIGMDHENAGDLFVLLRPGYVFQQSAGPGKDLFGTPIFRGDHGYSTGSEDSYGILIAEEGCQVCYSIDVANMVLRKLNLGLDD